MLWKSCHFLLKYILRAICYHILSHKKQQRPSESQQIKFRSQAHIIRIYWKKRKFPNVPVPKEHTLIPWSLMQFSGYKETDNISSKYSWICGGNRGMNNGGNKSTPQKLQTKHQVGLLLIYSQTSCCHVRHSIRYSFAYLIGQIIQSHIS